MRNALFFIFVIILGLAAFAGGIFVTFIKGNGFQETTAVIERIEEVYTGTGTDSSDIDHEVYVNYTVDGKEYSGKSDYYAPGYKEGKTIKIYYNPENPAEITGNSRGMGIYMIIIGAALAVGGVAVFVTDRTKKGRTAKKAAPSAAE